MTHLPGGQRRDRAFSLLPTPYTSRWQHMRLTPTALHLSGGQAQKRALCRVALWRLTWTCESVGVAEGADEDEPPPKMKLSSCGCPGYMAANPASFRLPNGWGSIATVTQQLIARGTLGDVKRGKKWQHAALGAQGYAKKARPLCHKTGGACRPLNFSPPAPPTTASCPLQESPHNQRESYTAAHSVQRSRPDLIGPL